MNIQNINTITRYNACSHPGWASKQLSFMKRSSRLVNVKKLKYLVVQLPHASCPVSGYFTES